MTGTMCLRAMRLASSATQKQSPGLDGATTGTVLRIASEECLQQIGLLGFRGEAGGRAATLDVADDERQFDGDCEAEGFCFERHAGPGGGGDSERARVGCSDGRSDAAISSSAWKVITPKSLYAESS